VHIEFSRIHSCLKIHSCLSLFLFFLFLFSDKTNHDTT
jgi:hypothetical protein